MTTINTTAVATSFAALLVNINHLRSEGLEVDVRITMESSKSAVSGLLDALRASTDRGNDSAAASAAPEVSAAERRIAAVTGSNVYANRTQRTSSGFKICHRNDSVASFTVNDGDAGECPSGWINVYAESLGKDIASSFEKAKAYASASVVATLPVFAA